MITVLALVCGAVIGGSATTLFWKWRARVRKNLHHHLIILPIDASAVEIVGPSSPEERAELQRNSNAADPIITSEIPE